jgi:HD-GYP domain-containing protein (c-di-GMP phosphodiesterase class II)
VKLGEGHSDELVVRKLTDVMRLRDPALADHAQRTAELATTLGGELGCGIETLDRLYTAAQLHDIGKLGISEAILWKPTNLSRSEWRVVRTHPEDGHRLVVDAVHREVASAVLYHHERMDGHGYPFGLDGHTLPLVVRVIQVADAFDAMTSDRPYQPALPTAIAVAEIERCSGSQFDPEVAAALSRIFRERDRLRPPPAPRPEDYDEPPDPFDEPAAPSVVRLRDHPA